MASELTIDDLYHEMRMLCISSSLAIAGSSSLAIARRPGGSDNDEYDRSERMQEEIP